MNLKEMRKAANLTLQAAAEKIGVSYSSISLWERGKVNPRMSRLERIAAAYGCTVADLLGIGGGTVEGGHTE